MDILIEEVIPEESESDQEEKEDEDEGEATADSEASQPETTDEDYSDTMSSEKEAEVHFIYRAFFPVCRKVWKMALWKVPSAERLILQLPTAQLLPGRPLQMVLKFMTKLRDRREKTLCTRL